jgi:hypothetical protein
MTTLRVVLLLICVAAAIEYLTYGVVAYPVTVVVAIDVRGPDGAPVPGATVWIEWNPTSPADADDSNGKQAAPPTKFAMSETDSDGKARLSAELPGTIRSGWVQQAIRWLGEDTPRRRGAVQEVLNRALVWATKDGVGFGKGVAPLNVAEVTDSTYGRGSPFGATAPVAMRIAVDILPEPKMQKMQPK